jgi:large subunit ribosomal protein L29
MQASEIREMTESDIQARITELQEERFRLRFRGATEQLEEPLRLRAIRRDVARLKTVLRQREMGEVATAPSASTTKAAKAPAKKRTAKKAASAGK